MKTLYCSEGRFELSDSLLKRIDAAANEIQQRFEKTGEVVSIDFHLGPVKPDFTGSIDKPLVRVAYKMCGEGLRVKALFGEYKTSNDPMNPPSNMWNNLLFSKYQYVDVRQIPEICFDEIFVDSIYEFASGLSDLRTVSISHVRPFAEALCARVMKRVDNEYIRRDTEKLTYLKRVARAADMASRNGDRKLLAKAIKTNPERKLWGAKGGD